MNFIERANYTKNPVAKKLFTIMHEKQTNLSVAADVTTKKELLDLIQQIGKEICLLKMHIDIIKDFDTNLIVQLQQFAKKYKFLLVEDRKFSDIGSTVKAQYAGGIYKIVEWADIVICHAIAGPAIIEAIKQSAHGKERALLLVAQMSCEQNLIDQKYTDSVIKMAKENSDFVLGCICQQKFCNDPGMFTITPGINIAQAGDTLGQKYNTPEKAIIGHGTDIIIVGRGIYKAEDTRAAAQKYRDAAWHAYQTKIANYSEAKGASFQAG